MVNKPVTVKIAANFERNLDSIENFLIEADAPAAFDVLLNELAETVIPNLENYPDIGRLLLRRPPGSVEVNQMSGALQKKLNGGSLHEYLIADYLILYARYDKTIYLLSIKHHRQLSFDLNSIWKANEFNPTEFNFT